MQLSNLDLQLLKDRPHHPVMLFFNSTKIFTSMVDISHTKIMSRAMDFFGYEGRENAVFFMFGMSSLGKEKIVWLIGRTT